MTYLPYSRWEDSWNAHRIKTNPDCFEHTDEARDLAHAIFRFANMDGLSDPNNLNSRYTRATLRAAAKLLVQLDKQGW